MWIHGNKKIMTMNRCTALLATLLLSLPVAHVAAVAKPTANPNLILITADEIGYFEPSYMRHPNLRTHNIAPEIPCHVASPKSLAPFLRERPFYD